VTVIPLRVLFIAPCHLIADERVLRTVRAALSRGCDCFLAVDDSIFLDSKIVIAHPSGTDSLGVLRSTKLLSLPKVSSNKSIARLQRFLYVPAVVSQASMLRADLIHIHESGILGLLLSFWFKRLNPGATVYFDYHDWIPYELSVFLHHKYWLYRLILPFLVAFCRSLVKKIDLVVAVSQGQAQLIKEKMGARNIIVIPNVRPSMKAKSFDLSSFEPSIVFVGNVMRSRMLELVVKALTTPQLRVFAPTFHIFGVVSDVGYRDDLQRLADAIGVGNSMQFHGSYRSDLEIQRRLTAGAIAYLFPLTFTPNPAAVEAISSSNKFFSYATLGLPIMIHKYYLDMASILKAYRAGFTFGSLDELVGCCADVWSDPRRWLELSHGSREIATVMNNNVYEESIRHYYG